MYTIGIDEAGRGALAGPIVVAAVAIPRFFKSSLKELPRLKDSKSLPASYREVWYEYLKGHPLVYITTSRVYQQRIDNINIARAANLAASRAYARLAQRLDLLDNTSLNVLLDGSLYLGQRKHTDVRSKTIIRGDQHITCIKLASVVAKVTRDRYMERLHQRYPEYNLERHKGYGTRGHLEALKQHGISDIHRLTYLGGYPNLKPAKK